MRVLYWGNFAYCECAIWVVVTTERNRKSQNIGKLVAELNALVSKMETQRGVCVTVADDLDSLHDMLNAAMEGTNSTAQNEAVGQLGAAAAKLLEAGGLISTACDVVSTYASTL